MSLSIFFFPVCHAGCAEASDNKIVVRPGHGSLQKAIDRASFIPGDVVIEMKPGEYRTDRSISITQGRWNSLKIIGSGDGKVTVSGDVVVPLRRVRHVTDKNILSRLQESVKGKILEVDCEGLIDSIVNIHPVGFGRESRPGWSEIIVNDRPLILSRWPDDTLALIGRIVVAGDKEDKKAGRLPIFHFKDSRPMKWNSAENTWIEGYFGYGWADDMVPVKAIDKKDSTIHAGMFTTYFFDNGKDFNRWYALNLPEEMDREREYVLDSAGRKFFFYPEEGRIEKVRLNVLEGPVIAITGCQNVTIEGIYVQNGRGEGISISKSSDIVIDRCTIRNVGNTGVSIDRSQKEAGHDNGVRNCLIYDTGSGGVILCGGDRKTLEPARNFVENCKIFRFNRIEKSYKPGVAIYGVGNRITKCDIHDAPSMAVQLHGNNHVIELCDIHKVCDEVHDQGAIYYGRNPSERGNIFRYNYFHDLKAEYFISATYHDDGACGSEVYGNIYYKAGSLPVLIGGGMDHHYRNNIFIQCPTAIYIDNRLQNWAEWMLDYYKGRLSEVNYSQPPYSIAYPELAKYWEDDPDIPKRNTFERNLFYKIGNVLKGNSEWGEFWNNWTTNSDPGFVDEDDPLKGFRNDAEVFRRISGFEKIPFDNIGCDESKLMKE